MAYNYGLFSVHSGLLRVPQPTVLGYSAFQVDLIGQAPEAMIQVDYDHPFPSPNSPASLAAPVLGTH